MKREEVIQILAKHRQALQGLFVQSLSLFESVARGEVVETSDVDLLVEFDEGHPTGLFEFLRLANYLEDLLGCKVDLVMRESLREEFREQVLREAVRAA